MLRPSQANRPLARRMMMMNAMLPRTKRQFAQQRLPTRRTQRPVAMVGHYQRRLAATHSHLQQNAPVPPPSREQLRRHFLQKALPMLGFGFMDQTLMLQAGDLFDCTLGVVFGLSTLTAAAFGQIFANGGSVLFGGVVERAAIAMGAPSPNFTQAQRALPVVRRTALGGTLVGVVVGCTLGLVNLLLIDTRRSQKLKILASLHNQPYEIEVSNAARQDATVITVRGPDRDGLLAVLATSFQEKGYSVLEVSAHPDTEEEAAAKEDSSSAMIKDVFVVQDQQQQIQDDKLQDIVNALQDATAANLFEPAAHAA